MKTAETLRYRCPHCDALVLVARRHAGETVSCVRCQRPFRAEAPSSTPLDEPPAASSVDREVGASSTREEPVLHEVHPAMFRNSPLVYLIAVAAFLLGLAAVGAYLAGPVRIDLGTWNPDDRLQGPHLLWLGAAMLVSSGLYLLAWWIQTRLITLTVTTQRSHLRRGLLSRATSEVRHDDVRNLQVEQSFVQRLLGAGTIAISSSGQDDFEIVARGVPRPDRIAATARRYQ